MDPRKLIANIFPSLLAQVPVSTPSTSSNVSGRSSRQPFAIWIVSFGLILSGLDLLYGISPDLPKLSSSSDPLLDLMAAFIILCFVGAIGSYLQKTWGYALAALVSLGFIIGAVGLNAWIPTLSNPRDYNTFIVAVTIVPALALVAVLTILCIANRKDGLSRKRYLASGKSFSGALTIIIAVLAIAGAVVGAYIPTSNAKTISGAVSVAIVNGAFNPSNTQGHFTPSTISVIIGVNNTVTWTNYDYTIHTVTSNSGVFDSGLLNNGNSWSYTFTSPGTFAYHCTIHPFMNGTVVVKANA